MSQRNTKFDNSATDNDSQNLTWNRGHYLFIRVSIMDDRILEALDTLLPCLHLIILALRLNNPNLLKLIPFSGILGCVDNCYKSIIPFIFCPHPLAETPTAAGILCKAMQEGLRGAKLKVRDSEKDKKTKRQKDKKAKRQKAN